MDPPYGVYNVPDYGPLPYCGIAGFHLSISQNNHSAFLHADPFTMNARQGTWMLDYTIDRLSARSFDTRVINALVRLFTLIKGLSRVERARETIRAFSMIHSRTMERARQLLNAHDELELQLALGLVQMYGRVTSTGYDPIARSDSLAAGLPHFATHHMRCWGRTPLPPTKASFYSQRDWMREPRVIEAFASCLYNGPFQISWMRSDSGLILATLSGGSCISARSMPALTRPSWI